MLIQFNDISAGNLSSESPCAGKARRSRKTGARALLNCFKRGSEPHSFPSLINFNAFSGTITADTKKIKCFCAHRARGLQAVDCRLYFSKPERNWNPLLPHHCLPCVPTRPYFQCLQYLSYRLTLQPNRGVPKSVTDSF